MVVEGVLLSNRCPQWINVPVATDFGLLDFLTVDDLAVDWWIADGWPRSTIVDLARCRRLVSLGRDSGEKFYIFFASQAGGHGHNECVLELSRGAVHVRGDILLVKIDKNGHPISIPEQGIEVILRTAIRSVSRSLRVHTIERLPV